LQSGTNFGAGNKKPQAINLNMSLRRMRRRTRNLKKLIDYAIKFKFKFLIARRRIIMNALFLNNLLNYDNVCF